MKSYQTYRSWETSARVVITKIWFRILIRPKRFGLTTKEKQNGKQQGMKIYRTYRYGELPYMCICNNANKLRNAKGERDMKKNKPAAASHIGSVSVAEHWYDVGYKDAQADAKAKRKKHEDQTKLMRQGSDAK